MSYFASRRPRVRARRLTRFAPRLTAPLTPRVSLLALVPLWLGAPISSFAADGGPSPDTKAQPVGPQPTIAEAPSANAVLPTISITASGGRPGAGSAVDPNLPATTETVTRKQFENWNVVNTEDALKYMPNLAVRKRFIGDLNSIIAVRGTSNTQSARGLVYADGLLLSNLLGSGFGFPPRWSMVFPDEIRRIDVIYGPYSALYPGNSLGATVLITTRMPTKFEAEADVKAFTQHFDLFGVNRSFNGSQASATIGDRIGKFSYFIGGNHFENTSQPLQFATLAKSNTPAKSASRA